MNIAICFYGQPRRYKEVLDQWKKIISELNADVFIHTWYGQDRGRAEIKVNELISDFSPTEISVSQPHKFNKLIPSDAVYENQSYHAMNQAYSISKSIQLMSKHSKNFNIIYDTVIRTRFDLVLENIDSFIQLIKTNNTTDTLYVSAAQWETSHIFDDNIMVGKYDSLTKMSTNYFEYTIQYINKTKVIPGGEHNLFRYSVDMGMTSNIIKINNLNFSMLRLPLSEIILNQNEE